MKQHIEQWSGFEPAKIVGHPIDCLDLNGHAGKYLESDLELAAEIGIRHIRYSARVWWKYRNGKKPDWTFSDRSLCKMHELGITPILDMAHMTDWDFLDAAFLNKNFPQLLAEELHSYLERYPFLTMLTPVNEPLVSSHFCGKIGVWYPYGKSEKTFLRMIINCAKAICLAAEVMSEQSDLELLVPDSCEKHQGEGADHKNAIRFIVYDLILGKVIKEHELFFHLLNNGIPQRDIDWFQEHKIDTSKVTLILGLDTYPHNPSGWNVEAKTHGTPQPFSEIGMEYALRYPDVAIAIAETNVCGSFKKRLLWLKFFEEHAAIFDKALQPYGRRLRAATWYGFVDPRGWRYGFLKNPHSIRADSDACGIFCINENNERFGTELSDIYAKLVQGTITHADIPAYKLDENDMDENLQKFLPYMDHYNWI